MNCASSSRVADAGFAAVAERRQIEAVRQEMRSNRVAAQRARDDHNRTAVAKTGRDELRGRLAQVAVVDVELRAVLGLHESGTPDGCRNRAEQDEGHLELSETVSLFHFRAHTRSGSVSSTGVSTNRAQTALFSTRRRGRRVSKQRRRSHGK